MTSSLLAIARDMGYLTPVFLPRMETAAFGKIKELLFLCHCQKWKFSAIFSSA